MILAASGWPIAAVAIAIVLGFFGVFIAGAAGSGRAAADRYGPGAKAAKEAAAAQGAILDELAGLRTDVGAVRAQLDRLDRLLRTVE